MSALRLDLERLRIHLHGVSAELAEQALSGLEGELRRRLAGVPATQLRGDSIMDIRLTAIDVPAGADAATLRCLIAGRLLDGLGGGSV